MTIEEEEALLRAIDLVGQKGGSLDVQSIALEDFGDGPLVVGRNELGQLIFAMHPGDYQLMREAYGH